MTSSSRPLGERRFQALVESSRDLIVVLGPQGRVEYVSPSVEPILGTAPDAWSGGTFPAGVHPEDAAAAGVLEQLRDEPGATWSGRLRLRHADGSWRVLDVVAENLLDDPAVQGVVINARDATRAAGAEAAQRERGDLLNSVVSSVPMVVFVLDREGRFTLSNGRGLESLGLQPGEMVGRSALEAYADHPGVLSDLHRALDGETFDTRRSVAGRVFELWFAPLEDGAVLGVGLDITERARAKEEQERLLRIIDSSPDFIGIANAEREVEHVNRAGRRMCGVGEDQDVRGWPVRRFHPEWAMGRLEEQAFPTAVRNGSWQGASAILAEDGSEIPVWQVIVAHPSESGEVDFLSTVCTDLTEREGAAAHIRFQASLLDAVGQAVIATDPEGHVIYWNRAAEELYGWSSGEAMGRSITDLVVPEGTREPAAAVMKHLAEGLSWSGEAPVRRKDGEEFLALVTNAPIEDADGALVGIVGVSSDLTDQKRLEEELREAQKLEAVGRLAGGIAHDFNNLLTTILGHVDLLIRDLDGDLDRQADLAEVQRAAQRAADLTRQLLAFGRRQLFQERVLDLGEEVRAMEPMLRRLVPESIHLEVTSSEEAAVVRADPSQIQQVVVNLVLNAVDALADGGRLHLEVGPTGELPREPVGGMPAQEAARPMALLTVRDDGAGMEPGVQERIFEPFFTTKELGKGTGLGLSTVFGIVKQSGGQVEVESEPGAGTAFHIYLPAAEREDDPEG